MCGRIVASQRKGKRLIHEGYLYQKNKEHETHCTWRCSERYGRKCKGRAICQVQPKD